jgi:hypothetical protein
MKKISIFLFLGFFFISRVHAAELSDIQRTRIENGIYELEYAGLQLRAVDIDMSFFYGWIPDDKEAWQGVSKDSISELNNIKTQLISRDLPMEIAPLRQEFIGLISALQAIYEGVEKREDKVIEEEYGRWNRMYEEYLNKANNIIERHALMEDLPDNFSALDMEIVVTDNEKDREIYKQAVGLIKGKNFDKAYEQLKILKEKYKGTVFEGCILLRMADCLLISGSDLDLGEKVSEAESGLELLAQVITNGRYYPVLDEAFAKWRTYDQMFNHGSSNWSEIPNKEYNEKRMEIVRTIQKYLSEKPKDAWAKYQILSILNLPNIERGGPYGNSNINHYAELFTDILEKRQKEKEKEAKN